MKTIVDDVGDFHDKFGLPVKVKVGAPDNERRMLREDLISEEYNELLDAMTMDDIENTADAAADLIYVVIGMCLEYGIDIEQVWKEVHRTNMLKEGGSVRSDGKILKPANWQPPDIAKALGLK